MRLFVLSHSVHCFFFFLVQLLLLLHFTISHASSSVLPQCNLDDSSALLQLKNSFSVNTSEFTSWKFGCASYSSKTWSWINATNCCQWDGVTCDPGSGHVIGLDLSCSNLKGEIQPNSTLFHLTHLQQLDLAFNDFSGSSIYPAIGNLVKLTHLNLSYSQFGGNIPSTISHLSNLLSLDLSNYNLRLGDDPSTWNKLILNATHLQEIVLDYVDMFSIKEGSLSLLMNLSSSLVSLHMHDTGLQGNFPSEIFCLPYLEELSMFNNYLRGELPKSNWSAPLKFLDLSRNAFSGEIPSSIGQLKSLRILHLYFNVFSGELPNSIGNLKYLMELWLYGCQFQGLVPPSLWNLTQLTDLSLHSNNFSGEIPASLSNLEHLTILDLQYNNFSGQIPNVFDKLTKLETCLLSTNKLGGQLPSSLFNLTQLSHIDLSFNKLVGPIPSVVLGLSKLSILALQNNLLNGTIPHWCFSLPSVEELDLSNNQLTGEISEFSTYSFDSLSLSNNKIQGNFPSSIFEFLNLTHLGLSSTNLSGSIDFRQFSKLKKLLFLDLSHNNFFFAGTNNGVDNIFLPNLERLYLSSCNLTIFPHFLSSRLESLVELDLSNKNIHGKIPKWFSDNLSQWRYTEFIDLSSNMLQGDLPIPSDGTAFFSVAGNNLTGGISSAWCKSSWTLHVLNLAHNNLTGTIPKCFATLPFLQVLDLQKNNLNGSIPEIILDKTFRRIDIETIKLNDNKLEGSLPHSLRQCTKLEVLDLGNNNIEDVFPSWLETLQELQVLILRANKFHGIISGFGTKHPFPKLRIFDVSKNNFSGPLPASYFRNFQGMMNAIDSQTGLKYMSDNSDYRSYNDSVVVIMKGLSMELTRILTTFTTIDLSNNMFEGEIPHVIGELSSLKGLNLAHNRITGTIPQSLGNLKSLEWLDLSWNQLKGRFL